MMLALMKEIGHNRIQEWKGKILNVLVLFLVYGSIMLVKEPFTKSNMLSMLLGVSVGIVLSVLVIQLVNSNKLWFSARYRLIPLKDWQVYVANMLMSCIMVWCVGLGVVVINWITYFFSHIGMSDLLIIEGDVGQFVAKNIFIIFMVASGYLMIYTSFVVLLSNWIASYVPKKFQKVANVLLAIACFQGINLLLVVISLMVDSLLVKQVGDKSLVIGLVVGLFISAIIFIVISIYLLKNKMDVRKV